MDNPRDDATNEQYRTRGAFSIAIVRSDPDTNGMEVSFASAHSDLKTKWRDQEDLDDLIEEHEALVFLRDRYLDRTVRSFELRLLDAVNKDRNDPRYRRYFGAGLRAVTEADARQTEPKLVRQIVQTLDEDQDKDDMKPLYAEFRNRLATAVDEMEAADAACTKVEDQATFLKEKTLVELKLRWVEERKKLHAELTKKFPHDPSRVEGYFRSFAKPRRTKKAVP